MNTKSLVIVVLSLVLANCVALGDFADPAWRYTMRKPSAGWEKAGFDESGWRTGHGGFGEYSTPGSRVSTEWNTRNIWLRRTIEVGNFARPALYIFHDEDAEVFINGELVAEFEGYVTEYRVVPLDGAGREAVKQGKNLLAVHCRQTIGGQAIDVHLIDADRVPKLPPAKRPVHPFKSDLITEWGAEVTAENAWREYPRPALVRDNWTNLNGYWDYAITGLDAARPEKWEGRILVPFAVESKLSGVQRLLHDDKALWYRRTLKARKPAIGRRVLLNFEACDYRTSVWVNGVKSGEHVGGNTPFHIDITGHLKDGENELVVRAVDTTTGFQLRGKQVANPHGIWYTQVSGIWGTVWLEEAPEEFIERLTISADMSGALSVAVHSSKEDPDPGSPASVVVSLDGKEVARAEGNGTVFLNVPKPKLWSPDSPTLYDLRVTRGADTVESYTGFREIGRRKDKDGHWRFTLNGKPVFHWGPLDQGWWPDGLLTPPSDAAMRFDVDFLKAAGFNMIRKHIKVEPRRFYSYCDRVGMMLWQDQVSGGPNPKWTRLQPNPIDAVWPDEAHNQFMFELDRMITGLENHPSIVVWVPFNEAWGQHRTSEVGQWTMRRDPTRLVNIASGGNFWPTGHIVDHHSYPHPKVPLRVGQ